MKFIKENFYPILSLVCYLINTTKEKITKFINFKNLKNLNKNIKAEFINVRELENYVLYQIASIRQTLNDKGKNIDIVQKECETLFSLTNSVVNTSKHPLFLQAHVFAGYCLNKQTAVAKVRRQLALMNVPMPLYFTNINKELNNDNTTEL